MHILSSNFTIPKETSMKIAPLSNITMPALEKLHDSSTLESLESDEQRRLFDVVAELRKCGLDAVVSFPQIVVCGQQSSGKSSTLEGLTGIPFPRNDNLCTRFATEIIMRRGPTDKLSLKIIPDEKRPEHERARAKAFHESIDNFDDLPRVMDLTMTAMGIGDETSGTGGRAFARDVLSIEIEGPGRPQLTLIDIPGLIDVATKGITQADIDMVTEITTSYIRQPRTICLAVISATSDYATQRILDTVRVFDPDGERTLGVITKPDRLPAGSGSEQSFVNLAQNKDVFFKLGWHVIKNRAFEEDSYNILERNIAEETYFRKSAFRELPAESYGIDALKTRLSNLLYEHVKQELPKLFDELTTELKRTSLKLKKMGEPRSSLKECRAYLAQISLDFYEICKAGVAGNYDSQFFQTNIRSSLSGGADNKSLVRRIRALVQMSNTNYEERMRKKGHKFQLPLNGPGRIIAGGDQNTDAVANTIAVADVAADANVGAEAKGELGVHSVRRPSILSDDFDTPTSDFEYAGDELPATTVDTQVIETTQKKYDAKNLEDGKGEGLPPKKSDAAKDLTEPVALTRAKALQWVKAVIIRTRGREVPGMLNPLTVTELFWEQSSKWEAMARQHVEDILKLCRSFIDEMLSAKASPELKSRLWSLQLEKSLNERNQACWDELNLLVQDLKDHPINYNHYFTETVAKLRNKRLEASLRKSIEGATSHRRLEGCQSSHTSASIDVSQAVAAVAQRVDPSMENVSCDEALLALYSLYKVLSKTFVTNVTTQVVERRIMRGLEQIFSPVAMSALDDAQVESIVRESAAARRQREFLTDRVKKLQEGQDRLREASVGVA